MEEGIGYIQSGKREGSGSQQDCGYQSLEIESRKGTNVDEGIHFSAPQTRAEIDEANTTGIFFTDAPCLLFLDSASGV